MKDKDTVCFRYKKEDGAIMYCCVLENKLYGDFDDGFMYLDLDNNSIENLINALRKMTE